MNPRKNNRFLRIAPLSLAAVVVVSFASTSRSFAANNGFEVAAEPATVFVNPPNLSVAAAYTAGVLPGTTGDIVFNATNFYSQPAPAGYVPPLGVFSVGAALNVGSVNVLATSQAITLSNGNVSTQAPLTLNGGDSISGSTSDLLYVATGATLSISNIKPNGGAVGNTLIVVPAASGNFNIAGTATIGVPIASGTQGAPTANAFAIAKTGVGTLTLTNSANNFTGGLTISGGILQLGNGGTTGKLANATAIINNANLTINRSNAVAQGTDFTSGPITGSGSLTQAGTGTTTLYGDNTYTGATNVTAGTLDFEGTLTSSITVGNLATITGGGTTTGSLTMNAGSTLLAGYTMQVNSLAIAGAAKLTFSGIPGGDYTLFSYTGTATGVTNLTSNYRASISNNTISHEVVASVSTFDLTWNSTNGTWAVGMGGWSGAPSYYDGDTVTFDERGAASVVTLAGNLNPGSVAVKNTSNPYTLTGTGSIGGVAVLTKDGAGALTMGTANTYSGGTTLNAGKLNINTPTALGTGTLDIEGGGIDNTSGTAVVSTANITQAWNVDFTFTGTSDLDLGRGAVSVGSLDPNRTLTVAAGTLATGKITTNSGQGFTKAGTGKLEAIGGLVNGVLNVAAGELRINRTGEPAATSGDMTTSGFTGVGTITNGSLGSRWLYSNPATGSYTFSGTLANGGTGGLGVYKGGAGTQIVSGTNSYTDLTTVNNGELILNVPNTGIGTSVELQGGKLTLGNAQALGTNSLINMTGTTSTLALAIDTDAIGGPYSFKGSSGTVGTIVSDRATPGAGINHTLATVNGNGIGGSTFNFTSGPNVTSGSGRVTFAQFALGAGTVQTTTLNPTTANVTLGDTSKQTNNFSATLNLGGTSTGNLVTGVISNGPVLFNPNNISLTKSNTSTWTLSGNNTYTGATAVNAGILVVNGDNSAATGAVTVAANATLAGNGNLGGNVTIATNGIHALNVAATSGAQITRTILGSLTHTGATTLVLTAATQPAGGSYTLVKANSPISVPTTVTYSGITGGSVSAVGNSLVLTITGGSDYDTWTGGFTFAPGANTTAAGDPDGDGLTNQQEYAFGLAPNSGGSVNPIKSPLNKATGQFIYTRRKPSLTGLSYTYQFTTDLAVWNDFTPTATVSDNADPIEAITVTAPAAVTGNAKVFIRVKAR